MYVYDSSSNKCAVAGKDSKPVQLLAADLTIEPGCRTSLFVGFLPLHQLTYQGQLTCELLPGTGSKYKPATTATTSTATPANANDTGGGGGGDDSMVIPIVGQGGAFSLSVPGSDKKSLGMGTLGMHFYKFLSVFVAIFISRVLYHAAILRR